MTSIVDTAPALANAREMLLASRAAEGHWEGRLSSSALSTATAVIALGEVRRRQVGEAAIDPAVAERLMVRGAAWLTGTQNADGGWGDTSASATNISTTALCWAALGIADQREPVRRSASAAEACLARAAGGLGPQQLARALEARYGKDRTFSVPILTALAIAGRLGPDGWRFVPQLPFELAACPHQWFTWLRLPVVSYALPALIAIGQARHAARPSRNPLTRALRQATRARTLETLQRLQPSCGGFLEATPLTSFVVMSLASCGLTGLEVVRRGMAFVASSVRDDGSWPIDTNLATWLTTLSVNALAGGRGLETVPGSARTALLEWLLAQQYREVHTYTQAAPGGWAWTDLPGGVPDADDTAGALLAIHHLAAPNDARARRAADAGVAWLLDLQNRDGGVPTFCRGWTGLPFDRSGPDLTAHAVRAWLAWRDALVARQPAIDRALDGAVRYFQSAQRPGGAFEPLWFGNEHAREDVNLTYGTARVLPALRALAAHGDRAAGEMAREAARWLVRAQHRDGGWGGDEAPSGCSIEETALAVAALADCVADRSVESGCVARGVAWLHESTDGGRVFREAPIGLYFAKLWYSERLYPTIFTVAALESAERVLGGRM